MCKLWNMFGPCRNYFGEKDWQQLVMFVRLADDLEYPVEVLGCPTDPRRRRRRGVEPQLAAHARATHGRAGALPGALRRAATPRSPVPPPRRRSSRCSPTRSTAPPPIQYFAVVDGPTMTPLEELSRIGAPPGVDRARRHPHRRQHRRRARRELTGVAAPAPIPGGRARDDARRDRRTGRHGHQRRHGRRAGPG